MRQARLSAGSRRPKARIRPLLNVGGRTLETICLPTKRFSARDDIVLKRSALRMRSTIKGVKMTMAFVLVVLSVVIFIGLDLILEGYLRRGRLQR